MNLAFTIEVVVKVCFILLQDIAPLASRKIDPYVDFHESTQPAKSESV